MNRRKPLRTTSTIATLAMMMVAAVLLTACGHRDSVDPDTILTEEFYIDSPDGSGDVRLFILNKHRAGWTEPAPNKTILFLHGATFSGSSTFALPVGGESWMDRMAQQGFDVYSLDIRGYGRSTRPPAMNGPEDAAPPVANTDAALEDVTKTVEFIRSRRTVDQVSLVGWSWGATIAARYAIRIPDKVNRLVLYAPQWVRDQPLGGPAPAGAWRLTPVEALKPTLGRGIPAGKDEQFVPKRWRALWDSTVEQILDPEAASRMPPSVKLPNGALADYYATWGAGVPAWNPEQLTVPTLVVQGGWDTDSPPHMGLAIVSKLTRARASRYVLIPEGSHTLMLETGRAQLFSAVESFLNEKF